MTVHAIRVNVRPVPSLGLLFFFLMVTMVDLIPVPGTCMINGDRMGCQVVQGELPLARQLQIVFYV